MIWHLQYKNLSFVVKWKNHFDLRKLLSIMNNNLNLLKMKSIMSRRIVILENIRSAYNVWNIIRTADSLWREVRIVGYTPSPLDNPKVCKTSLWAENTVWLRQFDFTIDAIKEARDMWLEIIAAELTENSVSLGEYVCKSENWIAVIFWNEVDWVMEKTLKEVDAVVEIPMQWIKESMNVGQSTAIFMRELRKF